MNVSFYKPRAFLLFLALLLAPLVSQAQNHFYEFVDVPKNDILDYEIQSVGAPARMDLPSNGIINVVGTSTPQIYIIEYIPTTGFVGRDTFAFAYGAPPFGFQTVTRVIEVEVLEAFATAERDFVSTNINTAVTIDLLANDDASDLSSLYLSNISLSNGGTVAIDTVPGQVVFTPDADFTGIAHFNYTSCVSAEFCDVGVATVFVEAGNTLIDTVYLATKRKQSTRVLLPLDYGYQEISAPTNGVVSYRNDGQLEYVPNNNFYGSTDQFTYAYNTFGNTSLRTFVIDVLESTITSDLGISKDDNAFVPIDGSVVIDVLANDNAILNPYISLIAVSPQNGAVNIVNGKITYTPFAGFNGVDQLTYKACFSSPTGTGCQNADVLITVDNMYPSSATFGLTTIKNTPLVVNYDLPFGDYDFSNVPEESLEGGYVDYYETFDGMIAGQRVVGENIIVYTPPVDYAAGDRFEFDYCPGNAPCQLVKIDIDVLNMGTPSDTFCVAECVWSGDADNNGVVNITDLLPVGYCTGEIGPARNGASMDWYGQFSDPWNRAVTQTEVNLKHVDTNGDGVINIGDTAAINQSYGRSHNLTPGPLPTISNMPLFFVPRNPGPYNPGDVVLIDVVLGNAASPALDVNGLTFAMNYNSTIVEPGSFKINFDNRSWMAYSSPMLEMVKYPYVGRAEAGSTRTSGAAASGYGNIAVVEFIVDDIIDGFKPGEEKTTTITTQTTAMSGRGILQTLPVYNLEIEVVYPDQDKFGLDDDDLLAYPNPAQDQLNIHVNGQNEIREYSVFSVTGRQMVSSGKIHVKRTQLDLSSFNDGLYILNVITENGIVSKKFEVLREPFK